MRCGAGGLTSRRRVKYWSRGSSHPLNNPTNHCSKPPKIADPCLHLFSGRSPMAEARKGRFATTHLAVLGRARHRSGELKRVRACPIAREVFVRAALLIAREIVVRATFCTRWLFFLRLGRSRPPGPLLVRGSRLPAGLEVKRGKGGVRGEGCGVRGGG